MRRSKADYVCSALYSRSVPAPAFRAYVDELADLLEQPDSERIRGALDGAVAAELRARVALSIRRDLGAFPTPRHLSRHLVGRVDPSRVYVDAALGCGDLLLAVAEQLPIKNSPGQTLTYWGRHLAGHDLEPSFVDATRIRLALLAAQRTGRQMRLPRSRIVEMLPRIAVGDGRHAHLTSRSTIVLNPPFGAVAANEPWARGRTNDAAVFLLRLLERAPRGVEVRAILPDVLRSGSRFAAWRTEVARRVESAEIETVGQFDGFADVDVFTFTALVGRRGGAITWWPAPNPARATVGDHFDVAVGAVVPHREPRWGREYPYLTARDLPRHGEHRAGSVRRRYYKRTFTTPFVAVRRTSSPRDRMRASAVLIRSDEPVAVENHLIVLTPRDGTIKTCKTLLEILACETTTEWLDKRIRCRHLTVGVLKELPWRGVNPATASRH